MKKHVGLFLATCLALSASQDNLEVIKQRGDQLSQEFVTYLGGQLKSNLMNSGVIESIDFCSRNAMLLTHEQSLKYGVTFSRKTDKPRNPGNALDSADTKTFTAMKIDMENKKPLSSKVIQAEDGHPIYYKPLLISNDVCLKCHGSLDKESENKIRSIYHEDKATGYKMGDLRALIRIDFNH